MPRGVGCGDEVPPSCRGRGLERGLDPSPENVLLFDLKMEHFGAVFKLVVMEETNMQSQEKEAPLASY